MKKGWTGQDELKFLVVLVPWSTPEKGFVFPMRYKAVFLQDVFFDTGVFEVLLEAQA